MSDYAPPLQDIKFVLDHVTPLDELTKLPVYEEIDADSVYGVIEEFGRLNREHLARVLRQTRTHGMFSPLLAIMAGIGALGVLWIGGRAVLDGRLTLGVLVAFTGYVAYLAWPTMALGWVLAIVRRGLTALGRVTDILDTPPRIVDGPEVVASLVPVRGEVELRQGKTTDARQHFETAISLTKGKDVEVFNAVADANIDAKAGDAAYAIEKLNQAMQTKKFNNVETYILLGDAYRKLIDGGNAVQSYQKALTVDPKYAEAKYKIGKIYLTQNNKEFFLPAFEEAVQMDPAYAPAYYELFYYYYFHWDAAKATDALDKYVANSDPGPEVEYLRTDFLVASGKFQEAKTKAQGLITSLGDKVEPRRDYISEHAYFNRADSFANLV